MKIKKGKKNRQTKFSIIKQKFVYFICNVREKYKKPSEKKKTKSINMHMTYRNLSKKL